MTVNMTINSTTLRGALACLAATAATPLAAQTPAPEILACYDAKTSSANKPQGSGIVYRIQVPGVVGQQGCVDQDHVQFSWTIQHGALTGLTNDDHPQYLKEGEPAGGDLSGMYPDPTVVRLQNNPVADVDPTLAGQVLTWTGSAWAPVAPAVGATGTPDNVPGTLVQRDPTTSGFAAGPVTLDGGFLVRGVTGGAIPATGGGARLMWHPGKAAFRAGEVFDAHWDDAMVGQASTAMGNTTTASGFNSTAMGAFTKATGNASTAMGSTTTASGPVSTAMGHFTTASGFASTAMGRGASTNGQQGSFVYGDASTATSDPDVMATAPNQFVVRAAGGFFFRTASRLSTGCDLPSGSGTFSCTSSREAKENFRHEDGERMLALISRLPVQSWNYRTQDPGIRHLGPTAQDFYAAFHLGEGETTISTVDLDGVNLVAVQALERRTREQTREIEALRAELAALRAEIAQRKQ